MPTIIRRLLLWTVICAVSAAPSFALAAGTHDVRAMVLGVCLFILPYTLLTSTETFERIHGRPFVRRTLYIGYGVRMALSVVFPLGVGADMFPGVFSLAITREVFRLEPQSFAGTLVATCVQGALLNVIVFAFMSAVYAVQRAFCRPPEEPRGFAVIAVRPIADVPG